MAKTPISTIFQTSFDYLNYFFKCKHCDGMLHDSTFCPQCKQKHCGNCIIKVFNDKDYLLSIYCKKCSYLKAYFPNFQASKSYMKKTDKLANIWWNKLGSRFNKFFYENKYTNLHRETINSFSDDMVEILGYNEDYTDLSNKFKCYMKDKKHKVKTNGTIHDDKELKTKFYKRFWKIEKSSQKKFKVCTADDYGYILEIYFSMNERTYYLSSKVRKNS